VRVDSNLAALCLLAMLLLVVRRQLFFVVRVHLSQHVINRLNPAVHHVAVRRGDPVPMLVFVCHRRERVLLATLVNVLSSVDNRDEIAPSSEVRLISMLTNCTEERRIEQLHFTTRTWCST
jgi:hypothetical protein